MFPVALIKKFKFSFPSLFIFIVPIEPVDPSPTYFVAKEDGDLLQVLFEGTIKFKVIVSLSRSPVALIVKRYTFGVYPNGTEE